MEQEYGLIGGNIFHGELSLEQLFHMRPSPGFADYRTPIAGLYNGSSATHAGGGVCGIPGWQAVRAAEAEQVAEDAQRKTEQAMETTSAKVEDGAAKAEAALKDAGDAAKEAAGKALGVADDAAITAQVAAGLAKDPELSALKINVDTKGGVVTLSGPAPTAQAKERATGIAKGVKGVGGVNNQLTVHAG